MVSRDKVIDALKGIPYPGFDKDIVTLQFVEDVEITPEAVVVVLRSSSSSDGAMGALSKQIENAVSSVSEGLAVQVLTGSAPQQPGGHDHDHQHGGGEAMGRKDLPGVKNIIPVTSGKGGVGKSTVSVNLAYSLSQMGNKVGLLDLDIFGPSVHKMLGANERLAVVDDMINPVERYGIKVISIGMAVEDSEAMIMRGPMVMKLIDQLINQIAWGELDYLIVDLPPGTGDVPLSLTQQVAIKGAVIVTTPQDVALIDVRRAVAMFQLTQTHILGIVENMSHYVCEKCGEVAHIFGEGGGLRESEKLGVPLLGSVPLTKSICEDADKGNPVFSKEDNPEIAKYFEDLTNSVLDAICNAPDPQTQPNPFAAAAGGGGGG